MAKSPYGKLIQNPFINNIKEQYPRTIRQIIERVEMSII